MRVLGRDADAALALPDGRGERAMSVHHLPSKPGRANLPPGRAANWGKLVHLSGRGASEPGQGGFVRGELDPCGSRWLRVRRASDRVQI